MADISAIFFMLLIIGIAFPAMLTAWWLLFPALITRAQTRIEKSLASSFWLGLIVVIALIIPIIVLLAPSVRTRQIHRLDLARLGACDLIHRFSRDCRASRHKTHATE